MKIYKFKVIPLSSFSSHIKGDLLYGFFNYWAFKLNKGDFLKKVIFSDFLPKDFFPKPALSMECFRVSEDERKEFKKIKFVSKKTLKNLSNVLKDKMIKKIDDENKEVSFFKSKLSVRNALNRFTNQTDEVFSVYSDEEVVYTYPIEMYVAANKIDIEFIEKFLNEIGPFGIGKKSSIKGKFQVELLNEVNLNKSKYGITLSPIVSKDLISYEIYTKYGKFFASSKPYKKPVIFADSGSVVEFKDFVMGENLENGYSKTSFIQGKSIIYPLEGLNNLDCIKANYEN